MSTNDNTPAALAATVTGRLDAMQQTLSECHSVEKLLARYGDAIALHGKITLSTSEIFDTLQKNRDGSYMPNHEFHMGNIHVILEGLRQLLIALGYGIDRQWDGSIYADKLTITMPPISQENVQSIATSVSKLGKVHFGKTLVAGKVMFVVSVGDTYDPLAYFDDANLAYAFFNTTKPNTEADE